MKPLNRRLLIEITKEEEQQGVFYVPKEDKPQEFVTARVLSSASDCSQDYTGKVVVIHAFGVENVNVQGKSYTFIGDNHLICAE